ncbi:hypothetical protein BH11PAT2_BH11PAT2_05080 [soil metagenome]
MRKFIAILVASSMLVSAPALARHHDEQPVQDGSQTQSFVLVPQLSYGDNGQRLALPEMDSTQGAMSADIEAFCTQYGKDHIHGQAKQIIKKSLIGGLLLGLGSLAGAFIAHFTGVNPMQYGKFGAGSGLGSGAFTGYITVEQGQQIFKSYCILIEMDGLRQNGDRRLKQFHAIPIPGLTGDRIRVNVSLTPMTRSTDESPPATNGSAVSGSAKPSGDTDDDSTTVLTPH